MRAFFWSPVGEVEILSGMWIASPHYGVLSLKPNLACTENFIRSNATRCLRSSDGAVGAL